MKTGIDQLGSFHIGPEITLPRRRKLKTLLKHRAKGTNTPPQSTAQKDIGAPKVDTFARSGAPNVAYTLR